MDINIIKVFESANDFLISARHCPCPKDVRPPENAGQNAESGAKMSGDTDDSHCMNDEPPK